nr:uncharacterized protein LOC112321680 isoform X1 [Desmodus rotundus]
MVPGKSLTFSGPQLPHLRITSTTTDSNSKECVQKTAKDPSILPNTHMSTGAARARTRWSSAYTGLPGQPMGVRGGDGAPAERPEVHLPSAQWRKGPSFSRRVFGKGQQGQRNGQVHHLVGWPPTPIIRMLAVTLNTHLSLSPHKVKKPVKGAGPGLLNPFCRERSGGSMGRLPQCCVSPPCPRMLPGLNTRSEDSPNRRKFLSCNPTSPLPRRGCPWPRDDRTVT